MSLPLLPRVASRVFNTPLAVHPGKAVAMLQAIGGRLVDGGVVIDEGAPPAVHHIAFEGGNPSMGRLGDPVGQSRDVSERLTRIGPVAVIPIEGTLVHKGKWLGMDSGETSYEGLWAQVNAARNDPSIAGVAFEVDSCGGEVSGAFDLADAIFELSQEKPTVSILTDHAYSAGYLLASAARALFMPSTGGVGSIGVITLHADFSRQLDAEGVTVTVLAAGEHKADGHPFGALPEDVALRIKGQLEALRVEFANALARFGRMTAADALATEALDFDASENPVGLGLADEVARPSEAIEAFVAEVQSLRMGGAGNVTTTIGANR